MNEASRERQLRARKRNQDIPAPRLPHERDESSDSQTMDDLPGSAQRDVIAQAQEDIESGQVDTDLRGSAGLDKPGLDKAGLRKTNERQKT